MCIRDRVNMGNTVNNQMPSKVVEYISTGKPILNLSVNEKCSTLGLMKRYVNGFQVFELSLIHILRISAIATHQRVMCGISIISISKMQVY